MFGKKMINFSAIYDVLKEKAWDNSMTRDAIAEELDDRYQGLGMAQNFTPLYYELEELYDRGFLTRDKKGRYNLPQPLLKDTLRERVTHALTQLSWSSTKTIHLKARVCWTYWTEVKEVLDKMYEDGKVVRRENPDERDRSKRWEYRLIN